MLWLTIMALVSALAQAPPAPSNPANPPTPAAPPTAPAAPDSTDAPKPTKAPKPKTRIKLLEQMQLDLDMAIPHAKVDEKGRKKLDNCHVVLIDAVAQQQRYKSVNAGKVNGCLKDLDQLDDAGAFADPDRTKLRNDREKLGESVGKRRVIHLPQPL